MLWYKFVIAGPVQQLPDGNVQVDVEAIPMSAWRAVDDYMVEHGYDWHGPDDAKRALQRMLSRNNGVLNPKFFPDHVDALIQALGLGRPAAKQKPRKMSPGLFNKVVQTFGLTNDLHEAGYILPDGSLLDMSAKNRGGRPGARALDHREIGMATGEGGTVGMVDFILKGPIRLMPETGHLHMGRMPTPQQFNRIREVLRQYSREGMVITLQRAPGVQKNIEYPIGTNPIQVINDIEKFYG